MAAKPAAIDDMRKADLPNNVTGVFLHGPAMFRFDIDQLDAAYRFSVLLNGLGAMQRYILTIELPQARRKEKNR